MELKELDQKTFDEFVLNAGRTHFMQSYAWGEVSRKRGYVVHHLGLYENNELCATALLLQKKVLKWSTFYCPRGPIVDYNDLKTVQKTIEALKSFVKKHSGLYLKVDPDLIIRKLDKDGSVLEQFDDNLSIIDFYKSIGGRHKGFTTNFIDTANPRFTFRVNVEKSEEELLSSFHNTTRKILKENNPYHLILKKGDVNDVHSFYEVMRETSLRKKMFLENEDFFLNFYETLHDFDMSDIYTVSVDMKELRAVYDAKAKAIEEEFIATASRPDGKKKENHLKDLENKKNRLLKDLKQIDEVGEDYLTLSSIITAKHKDKVWLIHGGNRDELMFLNGNYELYYHIIKDSAKDGYKEVDFFGSEGVIDPKSPIYGIYLFKVRFGGDFDEFSGEFDFITKPLTNSIISLLLKVRRRILYYRSLEKK